MNPDQAQQLESFLPVYDTVPEKWEEARQFLVEQLKRISNAVNVREIGWLLDEELLAGKLFIPSSNNTSGEMQLFRTVLRIVIDASPLIIGANTVPHGITVDVNFTLIDMWVAATNSTTPIAQVITGNSVTIDATNINITSPGAFDRAFAFVEYIQEI